MECNDCVKEKCMHKNDSINIEESALPSITRVFLIVTRECNLRCRYCYVEKEPANISFKTAIDAVEFIAKNARNTGEIPSINFFGGEPLLRWNEIIVPVTIYIREKYEMNFKVSITTNGLLLDINKLEFMKKYNIKLLFSMDGNKNTQDLNRPTKCGGSSFDILVKQLPLMLKYYPNLRFRATADNVNVKEYFNNHKFAVENGFNNIFTTVNVFSHWTNEQKSDLKNQIDLLGDYYFYLLKQGKNINISPFAGMFKKLKQLKLMEENKVFRNENPSLIGYGKCGLGAGKTASVGIDGSLHSCQEMVGDRGSGHIFNIGNIYTGIDNSARINLINKFNPIKVVSTDGKMSCKSCKLYNICDGGCIINNYFVTGDLNIMPSIICFYYQSLLGKAEHISKLALKQNLNLFI